MDYIVPKPMFDFLPENFPQELFRFEKPQSYPPHNVIFLKGSVEDKCDSDSARDQYIIELAVAGFKKEDLYVLEGPTELTVVCECNKENKDASRNINYLHRGISKRDFKLKFRKNENLKLKNTNLEDGILTLTLEKFQDTSNVKIHKL